MRKTHARLRLATVVSLDSRRTPHALMHREQSIAGQLLAFPSERLNQRRPRIGRDALALPPLLDRIPGPTDIGSHRGECFPTGKDIFEGAHALEYASDGLSVQEPTMIPMTVSTHVPTISPMGRGTTPVKFRAEMAKRLTSARIVAGFTTKKQAADALGVGLDRYEKWETGRTPIPAQYVGPVCDLYAIDANYLFGIPSKAAAAPRKAG
jgi:hypothetical protein